MNTAWKFIKLFSTWGAIAMLGGMLFLNLYERLPVADAWKLQGVLVFLPPVLIGWVYSLIQKYYELCNQEGLTKDQKREVKSITEVRIKRCWLWIAFLVITSFAIGLSALPWEEPLKLVSLLTGGGFFFMTLASIMFYPSLYKELENFKSEIADQQREIKKRSELLSEMRKASLEGLKGADIFDKYQEVMESQKEKPNKTKKP